MRRGARRGELEVARVAWEEGIRLAHRQANPVEADQFSLQLAILDLRSGDVGKTEARLKEVIASALSREDRRLELVARPLLANCYSQLNRIRESKHELRTARILAVELGRSSALTQISTRLMALCIREGDPEGELDQLEQEIAESEAAAQHERGMARFMTSKAERLLKSSRSGEAIPLLLGSLEIDRRIRNARGAAIVLHDLARAYQDFEKWSEAESAMRESLALGRQAHDDRHCAIVLESLGALLHHRQAFEESLQLRRESVAIGERRLDRRHLVGAYVGLVRSLLSLGQTNEVPAIVAKLCDVVALSDSTSDSSKRALSTLGKCLRQNELPDLVSQLERRFPESVPRASPPPKGDQGVTGTVKVRRTGKDGKTYGFIKRDDGNADVFFAEDRLPPQVIAELYVGTRVRVDAILGRRGQHQASKIEITELETEDRQLKDGHEFEDASHSGEPRRE